MCTVIAVLTLLCLSNAGADPSQKAVVGVTEVQTAAQNISCAGWEAVYGADCNAYLSSGFRTMLETAIFKTGKMSVLERARLDVFEEQMLGQAGLADAGGRWEALPERITWSMVQSPSLE